MNVFIFQYYYRVMFSFYLICVCVWYVYLDVIKLLVGGNGIFGLILPWECTSYLGKTPNTSIPISLRRTESEVTP